MTAQEFELLLRLAETHAEINDGTDQANLARSAAISLRLLRFAALAQEAKPAPASGGDDDWGSERQIDALNLFFVEVEKVLPEDAMSALESFNMKATPEEMVDEAMIALRKHYRV